MTTFISQHQMQVAQARAMQILQQQRQAFVGQVAIVRGGDCGIITMIDDDGWYHLDGSVDNAVRPEEVYVLGATVSDDMVVQIARHMGVDPLKAARMPQIVRERREGKPESPTETSTPEAKKKPTKAQTMMSKKKSDMLGADALKRVQDENARMADEMAALRKHAMQLEAMLLAERQRHDAGADAMANDDAPSDMRHEVKTMYGVADDEIARMLDDGWQMVHQQVFAVDDDILKFKAVVRFVRQIAVPSAPSAETYTAATVEAATVETATVEAPAEVVAIGHKAITLGPIATKIAQKGVAATLDEMDDAIKVKAKAAYDAVLAKYTTGFVPLALCPPENHENDVYESNLPDVIVGGAS